jgi:hypothetical protein
MAHKSDSAWTHEHKCCNLEKKYEELKLDDGDDARIRNKPMEMFCLGLLRSVLLTVKRNVKLLFFVLLYIFWARIES